MTEFNDATFCGRVKGRGSYQRRFITSPVVRLESSGLFLVVTYDRARDLNNRVKYLLVSLYQYTGIRPDHSSKPGTIINGIGCVDAVNLERVRRRPRCRC
jgi:hypothetical protein